MRIVQRPQQRFLLIIAALLSDRTLRQEFLVKLVSILKSRRTHSRRRPDRRGGLLREGNVERSVFAAQKPRGRERFEFLALAEVEPLPDVDKGGHGRVQRPQRARDDRAQVGRGGRLRRSVAGVPLVLVP